MAPAINMKVSALSDTLTGFEQAIATTLAVDTTSSSATCAPMMVIFARGTTEPGNVGLFSGPPFFDALEAMMGVGAVSVQGVEYGASIEGFLQGGDPTGSAAMATMIQGTAQNCPNAKIVMSGYSQGGQLVHNAAAMLPAATMAKVSSVVIFGDPNNGKAVANAEAKTLVVCHPGDNICDGGDLILVEHLTYSKDAVQAATFVAGLARA
ncbi:carbohydrate esterase family 5 protein [Cadophora sp. DSE1049]|nr:carbohydrate esterase family 5 protein [Cadophora sp. DSE1049]